MAASALNYQRMIGATACVAPGNETSPLLDAPRGDTRLLDLVQPGNCYPTCGCEDEWCALEMVGGIGFRRDDVAVAIVTPIDKGGIEDGLSTAPIPCRYRPECTSHCRTAAWRRRSRRL